jgi:hypothetical protein
MAEIAAGGNLEVKIVQCRDAAESFLQTAFDDARSIIG